MQGLGSAPGEVCGARRSEVSPRGNLASENSHSEPAAAVAVEGVSFGYGKDRLVLDDLSVRFPAGKLTCIVGPNGCGKSTLLKLADGLLKPSAGRILMDGRDTAALGHKDRARLVAFMVQEMPAPHMSVVDLVACGRFSYGASKLSADDRAVVDRCLALADLDHLRAKSCREVSGGERRRAQLAMCLAQQAPILLLDEPTSYLDIAAAHRMMDLVSGLCHQQGTTALMVVHDIDLALRYSDHLVVMSAGSVLGEGCVDDVLASGAIQRAFSIAIHPTALGEGTGYVIFPQ